MASFHCPSCDKTLPEESFSKNKTCATGYSVYCKPCGAAKQRLWKQNNREKVKQWKARYLEQRKQAVSG